MKYTTQRYLYPPRPKNAVPQSELSSYDDGSMSGQLKFNGSNSTIYTNGERVIVMNRHNGRLTNVQISDEEIKHIYKGTGGWSVINGEYLNKSKRDENGNIFNHKFIIFDILVNDGDYLVGKTFSEREALLDELYGKDKCEKEYLYGLTENIYRVKSYENNFNTLFDIYSKIDIIEGFVLKRKNSRLETSGSETNNHRWQIKCRKSTKNYKY